MNMCSILNCHYYYYHYYYYYYYYFIIIIIIIDCNWVVTRGQWLFYMYTKYEIGY